ncbi:MAG TPA: AraC family transcriptional regulator [Burkholderiaceae bacterium]
MRTSPAFPAPVADAAYEGDLMRDPDFGFEPPERCGLVRCLTHGIPSPLVRWHYHEDYELHLIVRTSGTVFVGDYIGEFRPGHVALTGPGLPHNWVSTGPTAGDAGIRDLAILFPHDPIESSSRLMPELRDILPLLERARCGVEFFGVSGEAEAYFWRIYRSAGAARLSVFLELMARLAGCRDYKLMSTASASCPEQRDAGRQVAEVIDYIQAHHAEDLPIEAVSRQFRIPQARLSRLLRQATGGGYSELVNRVRVGKACQLLMESDRYVTQVCYDAGFNNLANFNRRFLAIKGMTPTEFRRQAMARFGKA